MDEFSCKRGWGKKQKMRGGVILIPKDDSLTLNPDDITPTKDYEERTQPNTITASATSYRSTAHSPNTDIASTASFLLINPEPWTKNRT